MKAKSTLIIKKYLKKRQRIKLKNSFENTNYRFPLVTIVTVVLNNEAFIEKTIQSVLNQTYQNIEYIIIDGGSTDGTLNIIRKYEKFIDCWVSEKDKSIYSAMNKGLQLAKGKWINFMNSGDTFYSKDTINSIPFSNFQNNSMVYGSIRLFNKNRKFLTILKPLICNKLNLTLYANGVLNHQSVFYNADIKFRFPDKYKVLGDFFSYFEYIKHGPVEKLDVIICNYYLGGFSKPSNQSRSETLAILKEQVGVWFFLYLVMSFFLLIKTKIIIYIKSLIKMLIIKEIVKKLKKLLNK
jgi:glycosyltransferase involved in cell wall biosynthesis